MQFPKAGGRGATIYIPYPSSCLSAFNFRLLHIKWGGLHLNNHYSHRAVRFKMSTRVEHVLRSLTLEEKITLLAGKDFWETVSIPNKGVPAIKARCYIDSSI